MNHTRCNRSNDQLIAEKLFTSVSLILSRWWLLCKPFVRISTPHWKIESSDSWFSYMPGILDEFSFKKVVIKGLVIVNVADLSIVTSASICHSLPASVKNGLHTATQFHCLCCPRHCDCAAICSFLWMVNCIRNGERAALEKICLMALT